jgi:hypothetical protein
MEFEFQWPFGNVWMSISPLVVRIASSARATAESSSGATYWEDEDGVIHLSDWEH